MSKAAGPGGAALSLGCLWEHAAHKHSALLHAPTSPQPRCPPHPTPPSPHHPTPHPPTVPLADRPPQLRGPLYEAALQRLVLHASYPPGFSCWAEEGEVDEDGFTRLR